MPKSVIRPQALLESIFRDFYHSIVALQHFLAQNFSHSVAELFLNQQLRAAIQIPIADLIDLDGGSDGEIFEVHARIDVMLAGACEEKICVVNAPKVLAEGSVLLLLRREMAVTADILDFKAKW